MLKKCKVVMLPTNKKANIGNIVKVDNDIPDMCNGNLFDKDDLLIVTQLQKGLNRQQEGFTTQHLYILSKDKIEDRDWCILLDSVGNPMSEAFRVEREGHRLNKNLCKITASTNQLLGLPEPSQAFIEKYVDLYNKGQQIKEVEVEYELVGHSTTLGIENWEPKVSSDNTITIRKIKDSYTREEVVKLFDKLNNDLQTEYNVDCPYSVIEHWLKENL